MSAISEQERPTLETTRRQMVQLSHEIREYLSRIEANVEGYKFHVEKHGDGIEVEVEFKALIHPKTTRANIPK